MGQVQSVEYARGMISLLFGIGTIVIALVLTLMAALQTDLNEVRFKSGKEILTVPIGVFGTILGFYFGSLADGRPDNPDVAGLRALGAVIGPNSVDLSGTRAGDNDLLLLKSLPQTQRLYLDNTDVTDKGLVFLQDLTNLKSLSLNGTKVKSIASLQPRIAAGLTVIYADKTAPSQSVTPPSTSGTPKAAPAPAANPPAGPAPGGAEEFPPAPSAPGTPVGKTPGAASPR